MPAYEPTDKELNDLMKEVVKEVRENAIVTKNLIQNSILFEIQKVKSNLRL